MKLVEVLEDKIFDLPLGGDKYFPGYLESVFLQYIKLLKLVDDEFSSIIQKDIAQIELLCNEILEITNCVFRGNTSKAYSEFSTVIQKLESYLKYPNKNAFIPNPPSLYKARKIMEGTFGLTDMFHVPFEKRYFITTSRFSLPGVPCLYLANSVYTCWEELDRPIFSQMPVSRFEITGKHLKFLDLSNKASFIRDILSTDYDELNKVLCTEESAATKNNSEDLIKRFELPRVINAYPLYAACYTQVNNKAAHFKPEYIFPQMLMQWIMTQDDIDGIKYFSTKCKSKPRLHNLESFLNYAIPVQSFQETGYCKTTAQSFSLTEPITFELLNILDPVKASTKIDWKKDYENKFLGPAISFINVGEKPSYYLHTSFGILEYELLNKPVKNLAKDTLG